MATISVSNFLIISRHNFLVDWCGLPPSWMFPAEYFQIFGKLTPSYIMLENGQTYFKNLLVNHETFKVCLTIFQHHAWKQFALNQVVNLYSLSLVNTLTRVFSVRMEKANVVPVHKKSDKECLKNYWPVSLLPICGKIPERLTFNGMFRFLIESNLISSNQSGFKPGDSCINQVLFITHEICISLDDGV